MEQDLNTRWIDRIRLVKFRRRLKEEIRTAVQRWVIGLFRNITATIDNTSGTPSVTPHYDNTTGIMNLAFSGLKGATGQNGQDGANGKDGKDGTGITPKTSAEECVEINDCYIDNNPQSPTYGHFFILKELPDTFVDEGMVKGPKGDPGQDGINGTNGKDGKDGINGANGEDGNKWYTKTQVDNASQQTVFKINDFYINTANGDIYMCTTGGTSSVAAWEYQGNIKGTPGRNGTNGSDGRDGSPGRDGSIVSKAFRFIPDFNHSIIYSKEFEARFYNYGIGDARITLTDNNRTNIHLSILVYSGDLRWDALMAGADAYESGDVWTGPISGYLLKPNGMRGEEVILPKADPHGIIYKDTWYGTITVAHQLRWKTGDVDVYQPLLIDLHGEIENLKEAEMLEELFSDGMTFLFDINK